MAHIPCEDESLLVSLSKKIDGMSTKVDKVYDAIYGVEGHGGLRPWVEAQEKRLLILEQSFAIARAKLLGAAMTISCIVSFATFIVNYFVKK